MLVAVAGGTGLTGRHVVGELEVAGLEAVVLARSSGVDLTSGAGLDAALDGVDAVIDVSNVTTFKRDEAVGFFERAGQHLLGAAARAGVRHHLALSIVGIDRVSNGYYQGKLRQEEIVRDGPVPWTVLRATQFHEFPEQILARVPGPIAVVPRLTVQPVAVREVARALVALVTEEPRKAVTEIAGPRVESLPDMARRLIRTCTVRRRPVLPLWTPGPMGNGGVLPTGTGLRGTQTFAQWLQERRR